MRGKETPPTKTAGRILQAQPDRFPEPVDCPTQKQISRHALRRTGVSRQVDWCFERCFPLTPALSLGERENRPPRSGESNALGRAGAQALNRGARGASGSDVRSKKDAGWLLPLPFPMGEGSHHRRVVYPANALGNGTTKL